MPPCPKAPPTPSRLARPAFPSPVNRFYIDVAFLFWRKWRPLAGKLDSVVIQVKRKRHPSVADVADTIAAVDNSRD